MSQKLTVFFFKFWMAAGDLLFSFLIAFMLHIVFEAPVQGILKLIFTPSKTGDEVFYKKS